MALLQNEEYVYLMSPFFYPFIPLENNDRKEAVVYSLAIIV